MIHRMWAALLLVALVMAGCGDGSEEPEVAEVPVVETVDLDTVPTVMITPTPMAASPTASPTALPTATPIPLPALLVWPTTAPPEWPQTPDEAARAFAQRVARGDRAAEPRPTVQEGTTATAELPRLAEDGSPFGLASIIHLQEVELEDGTTAWVVLSARSPDIVVDSPAVGETLAGGTVVVGKGQGFEGTIVLQIEDQDGLLGMAFAQGGALGENLPFEAPLPFNQRPASGDVAVLVAYTTSAVDGSLSSLTMLPMRLVDAS
ncbi:Gmad2 immunoglobulin-like domain-containing protein [Candidatus Poriferisocius sp.]|uniref:Gmad2 immunoglobulin-like domain-containing protein n=1 Tax=Candidatus Poriferisocius sp. TaxID=3101276 RepID=UPI003B012F40